MKTWIPWRRAWLMMLMKRIFYLGHCTFQTSIRLKKHSSSMLAILIILSWSKLLDCRIIFQKVTDILNKVQVLFCLFQTADLFLQEKTNCGKNWNNVGSPQSILVERPAVWQYWVSIFQVRNKKFDRFCQKINILEYCIL